MAPCHLAKQNDPDTHYNLCQQEANYVPDTATIRPSARRRTPKFAFDNPLCCSNVRFRSKNRLQRCRKCDPRDAGALRLGFSLILGLVAALTEMYICGSIDSESQSNQREGIREFVFGS